MPAWKSTNRWSESMYQQYRASTTTIAKGLGGTKGVDCADLTITPLVQFAAAHFLPVTFLNMEGVLLCSNADQPWDINGEKINRPWFSDTTFLDVVRDLINVKSLYKHNTIDRGDSPIKPGDLGMRYESIFGKTILDHAFLVFEVYPPTVPHRYEKTKTIPDFPGSDAAEKQQNVTEYFMGTRKVEWSLGEKIPDSAFGPTDYRHSDLSTHFDYLNSRGDNKRNAELIYYANAQQFTKNGFEFLMYAPRVLDNWDDWANPKARPPRGLGFPSLASDSNETNVRQIFNFR